MYFFLILIDLHILISDAQYCEKYKLQNSAYHDSTYVKEVFCMSTETENFYS